MDYKNLLIALGFRPKENATDVFSKNYPQADNYCIEVNADKQIINYGESIVSDSRTTLNFTQDENFVVLECVNRLLEKGYKPQNIILEKTWAAGHGTSGRLDICVTRDNGDEYLLIECKTYGREFDREFARMKKDGGQLFTYFKFSNKADVIMLYASELKDKEIIYRNEIIKIEEDYRTGDVKDFYEKWDKHTFDSGIWENPPYNFEIKKFTKGDLKVLNEEVSRKLFNSFASILRKHSVSDKPNAFNKIFNLFLAKLYDEQRKPDDELHFHWREDDDPVDFQVRLINLHKEGLYEFLRKEIEGINDSDFNVSNSEDLKSAKKKVLKFNKIFDIKEVFDDETFEQNHRVLKEIVKLLEKYQIRYPRKQLHLSEFFERLLTTGLKQEAGQYFTPPPIAKFIVKSLPLQQMIEKEINTVIPKLPATIDYAAGSGHFITEILEEYQDIIDRLETNGFYPNAIKKVKTWSKDGDPYSWASSYVYGIEKDYRLVKVAKVGCYFYGDGVAQIIHGDGLDSFTNSKSYIGLLKDNTAAPQFSIVVSNPPYSVNDCKDDLEYTGSQHDFTLYPYFTDKSREIETLFVERTGQLLKDDGVAGVILPSSILSNTGIYTKAREIILQCFKIVAIAKFGSNTFMETGTNTVVLFLRRRNDAEVQRIREAAYRLAKNYPKTQEDLTINGIEKPVQKYLAHTNATEIDPEKLYYFILAYQQKNIVIINSGERDDEKRFLGYEFSKRRGNEGMHSMQRNKSIDECTQLYDNKNPENPEKASTYIYKAFTDEYLPVSEAMRENVAYADLVDMLTFDRDSFDKNISLAVKKKVRIESRWDIVRLGEICNLYQPETITSQEIQNNGKYKVFGANGVIGFFDEYNHEDAEVAITCRGATCGTVNYTEPKSWITGNAMVAKPINENVNKRFLFHLLLYSDLSETITGTAQPQITRTTLAPYQIPLPPKEIQQKIVSEIEVLEKKEADANEKIEKGKERIEEVIERIKGKEIKISDVCIYSDTRIDCNKLNSNNYVGVDNLLQNMAGKTESSFVPENGTVTEYKIGNILLSNIRPYLKKIWYADNNGGSSNDVLVLQIKEQNINSKYVYFHLKRDEFFDYEMLAAKGVKMPRGDKQHILDYKIPLPPLAEQQKIVSEIEEIEEQIAEAQKIIDNIPTQKNEILKKYL